MDDVIIVGSGAAGVSAAFPLTAAGLRVRLLDVGNTDGHYAHLVPPRSFSALRHGDPTQHRYFLGDDFEGILLGSIRVGTKLTPPRGYVMADAARLTPVAAEGFVANESLARGGLAESWGAGALPFCEDELAGLPLSRADLEPHYRAVAERIGISGADDDLAHLCGTFGGRLQPPLELDSGAARVMAHYRRRRARCHAGGFYLGRARLAVCTRPLGGRSAHQYRDMDYWADTDTSVYRPRYDLAALQGRKGFTYTARRLVSRFDEAPDGIVTVGTRHVDTGVRETFQTRALVLAAGTLGSARIVLRSRGLYGRRVPVLTNPYTYVPCINRYMLGRRFRDRRCSLSQLAAYWFPADGRRLPLHANYFSYRSLLTFKLLKEAPLPQREALQIMRALMPLFGIVTIFHPDAPDPGNFAALQSGNPGAPDRLQIHYAESAARRRALAADERAVLAWFRRLGCLPLKRIHRAPGSSIHYAGTLPMRAAGDELTCDRSGRLRGTRSVFLADGAVLSPLPATVLTLTIMAHADRVGGLLARRLKGGGTMAAASDGCTTVSADRRPVVAITGASGLLGRHLCRHFAAAGYPVRALLRSRDAELAVHPGIDCRRCELPDRITPQALAGVDVLIHGAYATRATDPDLARRVNEEGTHHLVAWARAEGVRQLIFVSSRSARPDAPSYYARSKHRLEGLFRGKTDLVVRPGLILARHGGLFARLVATIERWPVIPLVGGGRQPVRTVHIDDLCRVFEWAVRTRAAGVITAVGDDGLTMADLLQAVAHRLGKRRRLVRVPAAPLLAVCRLAESVGLRLPVSSENLRGLTGLAPSGVVQRPLPAHSGITLRPARASLRDLLG